jgi:NADPH2:quinone reductase
MGVEAAGVIEAVGAGVTGFAAGDRVTYTGSPLGAYSTERVMPVDSLIKLPDSIPFETAAAMTMRGLTTSYLLRRIAPSLKAGDTVLLHAAAGGVGLIFCQWARLLGINVIGTVSTDEKAEIAKAHGCTHTIIYTREDVPTRVRELTDGAGVPVAYDSIGKSTFASSLDSLARRGLLVCFGTSSGAIPPIDAMQLAIKGSLFVTRPALADYIADPDERAALAGELFDHVGSGRISIEINQRYALEDAAQAHRDLETGRSIGSSVFCLDPAA